VLIIGCGRLGQRVAAYYQAQGETVAALVRTEASAERLQGQGIQAQAGDLDRGSAEFVSANQPVFYFAPPPAQGQTDPRMGHLINALGRQAPPRRVVYISTSGVYGDCQGAWIDETWPVRPQADRARRRLDAENQLRDWGNAHGVEWVILRVAGVYGPDRLPLQRIRQGLPIVRAQEAPFTNRIHEDDLLSVCIAAMERPVAAEIFNVSDGHPGTMAEYFDAVANYAGLPPVPKIGLQEADACLSAEMRSYMAESRRMDNRKLRAMLVAELKYPRLCLADIDA
jgi:nucleoside-diphosphate-sugar epimerase